MCVSQYVYKPAWVLLNNVSRDIQHIIILPTNQPKDRLPIIMIEKAKYDKKKGLRKARFSAFNT